MSSRLFSSCQYRSPREILCSAVISWGKPREIVCTVYMCWEARRIRISTSVIHPIWKSDWIYITEDTWVQPRIDGLLSLSTTRCRWVKKIPCIERSTWKLHTARDILRIDWNNSWLTEVNRREWSGLQMYFMGQGNRAKNLERVRAICMHCSRIGWRNEISSNIG